MVSAKNILSKLKEAFTQGVVLPVDEKKDTSDLPLNGHDWFTGNYSSWEEAMAECTGYGASNIFEKVKNALIKVKNGEAVYERDSVLFDKTEYSFPLLTSLMYSALALERRLSVLDFGGSLGSSYYQNKTLLNKRCSLRWSIIEQEHFVTCGKDLFEDENLKFYYSISECLKEEKPNVILLSGVLQYLEKPYQWLEELLSLNCEYLLIDRTPFQYSAAEIDYIAIQKVPTVIYDARIPFWTFSKSLLNKLVPKYRLLYEFPALDGKNEKFEFLGFFFEKKA